MHRHSTQLQHCARQQDSRAEKADLCASGEGRSCEIRWTAMERKRSRVVRPPALRRFEFSAWIGAEATAVNGRRRAVSAVCRRNSADGDGQIGLCLDAKRWRGSPRRPELDAHRRTHGSGQGMAVVSQGTTGLVPRGKCAESLSPPQPRTYKECRSRSRFVEPPSPDTEHRVDMQDAAIQA